MWLLAEPFVWLVGGGVALWQANKIVSSAGTTVQQTGNSTAKVIAVGAVALIALHKYGVLKGGIKV